MPALALTIENLQELFTYHPPKTVERMTAHQKINDASVEYARVLLENSPDSPERTIAIRKIQEARMFANAAAALYMERE